MYTLAYDDVSPLLTVIRVRAYVMESDEGEFTNYSEAFERAAQFNANRKAEEIERLSTAL